MLLYKTHCTAYSVGLAVKDNKERARMFFCRLALVPVDPQQIPRTTAVKYG